MQGRRNDKDLLDLLITEAGLDEDGGIADDRHWARSVVADARARLDGMGVRPAASARMPQAPARERSRGVIARLFRALVRRREQHTPQPQAATTLHTRVPHDTVDDDE